MRHYNYLKTQIRISTVSTLAHTSLRSVTIAALGASLVLSSACTKKDEASSGAATSKSATSYEDPVLAVPLLKKIPATAAGVAVLDLKGDAYKKFLNSPFADAYNSFNVIKTVLDEADKQGTSKEGELAGAKVMLEALKKLGAISAEGKPQLEKVFGQFVVFVDTPPAGKEDSTNVGILASAADGANMKEKLAVVEGLLKDSGVPTAKETYQGGEGFAVPLSGVSGASSESNSAESAASDGSAAPAPADELGSLFFASTDKLLVIGRSKAAVEGAFKEDTPDGFAVVKHLPEFQKAFNSVRSDDPSLSMMFISLQRLAPAMQKLAAESGEPSEFDPKTFPVDAFFFNQTIASQLSSKVAVVVNPRTENQKTIFGALDGATTSNTTNKLPSDVAFAISLDTKFVSKLEPLLKDVQDNPASAEGFKVLKNLLSASIAIRNNDAGSPFPDLFFALEATDRTELAKILETLVGQAMASSGAPAAPWQGKDIAGASTRFFSTPFGVGMYIASPKDSNSLLIASSERAVKDALSAGGETKALAATLSPGLKERAAAGKLGMVYLNFNQVANMVDSVKGSLAMFVPNSEEMNQYLDSSKIRQWGSSLTAFGYSDGVLTMQSAAEIPAVSK